jgi:hypothetical protein
MLFYLDIGGDELSSIPAEPLSDALSELIQAHRSGHHLAVISRASAQWIRDHINLSERDKAMLDRIAQDFTQSADLRRSASMFVELRGPTGANLASNGNAIIVKVDRIRDYRVLERSILLVENTAADGSLYSFLLNNALSRPRYANISFDLAHGGGTSLEMEFRRFSEDRRVFGAVVDSDRDSPLSENVKLRRLVSIKSDSGWPLCFPTSPPCREAENIIPMGLAMIFPSGVANASNRVLLAIADAEIRNGHAPDQQFWLFFDIKQGLTSGQIERMRANDKGWIVSKMQLINIQTDRVILRGYGDRMLAQLNAENRFLGELRKLTRERRWSDVFTDFLNEMIWVFLAGPRIRT